jgi:hypothetical protein
MRSLALRRTGLFIGALVVCAALVVGVVALLNSNLFAANELSVQGVSALSRDYILKIAAIDKEQSTILFDEQDLEQKLEENVWVKDARVETSLPHKVNIAISERIPGTFVVGEEESYLLSQDGYWLGKYKSKSGTVTDTDADSESLKLAKDQRPRIRITELEEPNYRRGIKAGSRTLANALAILDGLSPELISQLDYVSAPSVMEASVFTEDGLEIDIGSAEGIVEKDQIIRQIMKERAGDEVILINVRSIDKPTWRGLKTD